MQEDIFGSRFWRWYVEREPLSYAERDTLRSEALGLVVESVRAGEILTLDGVDSPLSKRIQVHHRASGFEMNSNWIASSQSWACPCCGRSKFQISRMGKSNQILAKLVVHHDHMIDVLQEAFHIAFEAAGTNLEQVDGQRLIERIGRAFAAYEEVLVCEDCNNADTQAKKMVSSPRHFSFSMGQIKQFIRCADHQPHQVDAAICERVWQAAQPAYDLRMKLIDAVARAAATDAHWYEPYARRMDAIPVLGNGRRSGDNAILEWVSPDALLKALGPKEERKVRNLSRWRTEGAQKLSRPLPPNFLAMLRSEESSAQLWDAVPAGWRCPICRRSKEEATYVGEKRKIVFKVRTNHGRGVWAKARAICNHCDSILMCLKLEASDRVGITPRDSYSFVSPDELSSIIIPRPHSPHLVRPEAAASLLAVVIQRLSAP